MKRARAFPWLILALASVTLLRAQPAADVADSPQVAPPVVEQGTRWNVLYSDNQLGLCAADATVDWTKHTAELRLASGQVLRASSVVGPAQGDGIAKLVFPLVSASNEAFRPEGSIQLGAQAGQTIELSLPNGPPAEQFTVADAPPNPTPQLVLELEPDDDGDLRGKWSYTADPLTLAEKDLAGRTGSVAIDPANLETTVTGLEFWTRQKPEIDYTAVVEDQALLDRVGAVWYPFRAEAPKEATDVRVPVDKPGPRPPNATNRTLLMLGRNFPPEDAGWEIDPTDAGTDRLKYTRLSSTAPENAALLAAGWSHLTQGMDEASIAELKKLEVALVRVFLPRELPVVGQPWHQDRIAVILPGPKTLNWQGGEAQWALQFGDNLAQLQFVRPHQVGLETKWDPVTEAFLPEELALELRNPAGLPVPRLKIRLARGDQTVLTLDATRREEDGKVVWRTDLFRLAEPGKVVTSITAVSGDQILAGIDPNELTFVNGAQAALTVYGAPADIVDGTRPSATWSKALVRAAKANEVEIPGSGLRDVAQIPGQGLSHFFLFSPAGSRYMAKLSPERVRNDFQVGDYAAMLLLRETLAESLEARIAQLQDIRGEDLLVLGFANDARTTIARTGGAALARLPAGQLAGKPVTLLDALNTQLVDAAFPGDAAGAAAWRVNAYRTALDAQSAGLVESVVHVRAIPDTDVEKLLGMTSRDLGPLVKRAAQRLVVYDEKRGMWRVDDVARGYLDGLPSKYAAVVAVKEAASAENDFLINVATQAVSMGALSWPRLGYLGAVVAAGCNGLPMFGDTVGHLNEVRASKAEVRFALGAAPVLGDARYQSALEEEGSYFQAIAMIAIQGATVVIPEGLGVLRTYQAKMAVRRGELLFERLGCGLGEYGSLSSAQRRDLRAFAQDARARLHVGTKVTEAQALAVKMWYHYEGPMSGYAGQPTREIIAAAAGPIREISFARREIVQARFAQASVIAAGDVERKALVAAESAGKAEFLALRQQTRLLGPKERAKVFLAARKVREAELKVLKDRVGNFETREQILRLAMADAERALASDVATVRRALSEADLAWLSGRQLAPDPAVVDSILSNYGNNWPKIKKAYESKEISAAQMHQFVSGRKQRVEVMLGEAMAEVQATNAGTISGELKFEAFGSTNLTSDFDVSVKGEGAELVVAAFNRRFRERYGRESGLVFDTNIYTDPVYKIFKRRDLKGRTMDLANKDLDLMRQFTYDQMATRKYLHDAGAWAGHKNRLLAGADEQTRAFLGHVFEEAEQANTAAVSTIEKKLGDKKVTDFAEDAPELLAARNRCFEDTLQEIHEWRVEQRRLDRILTGKAEGLPENTALLTKYPGWDRDLRRARQMAATNDVAGLKQLGDEWRSRMAYKMREKQGVALYFASEAYQTEATILHVVDELQKKGHKITLKKLLGERRFSNITAAGSFNSMMENRANMLKELDHVMKDGVVTKGNGIKAASKGAKYFIRILDAAHQSRIKVGEIVSKDLLELTIGVDLRRGSAESVAAYLKTKGISGEDLALRLLNSSNDLAVEVVRQPQIKRLAQRLLPVYDEVGTASEAVARGIAAAH